MNYCIKLQSYYYFYSFYFSNKTCMHKSIKFDIQFKKIYIFAAEHFYTIYLVILYSLEIVFSLINRTI
jgi:hypothetical protein